jgi:hypothetical protein
MKLTNKENATILAACFIFAAFVVFVAAFNGCVHAYPFVGFCAWAFKKGYA